MAEEKSLVRDFWNEKIRELIDAREFFRQRSEILKSPDLMLSPPTEEPDRWTDPLTFAVQSILLQVIVFSAVSQLFVYFPHTMQHWFHLKRAAPQIEIQKIVSDQKSQLHETNLVIIEVQRSAPATVFFFAPYAERLTNESMLAPEFDDAPHPRDEFVHKLEGIKSDQSREFACASALLNLTQSLNELAKEWGGFIIVLMAIVFRRIVRLGKFKATRELNRADSFFLYYFTAVMFPINIALKVLATLQLQLQRYGAPDAYLYGFLAVAALVCVGGWLYGLWRSVPVFIKLLGFGDEDGSGRPKPGTHVAVGLDLLATVVVSQALALLSLFLVFLLADSLQSWILSLNL